MVGWTIRFRVTFATGGESTIQLGNRLVVLLDVPSRYDLVVVGSDMAHFRRVRGLVTAHKDVLHQKTSQPLQHTKHLFAAFAASHPQISVIYQELLISLAKAGY
jgi:hypothetical protein